MTERRKRKRATVEEEEEEEGSMSEPATLATNTLARQAKASRLACTVSRALSLSAAPLAPSALLLVVGVGEEEEALI